MQKDGANKGSNVEEEMKNLESSYSKKIRATKDPKEQTRLKEEMKGKMNELKKANQNSVKEEVAKDSKSNIDELAKLSDFEKDKEN